MEDFLPFLLFIIVGILSIVGKSMARKKKKQGAPPKKGGDLITRLNAFLTDVQKRMEAQSKAGAPGGQSGWEQVMGRTRPGAARPAPYEEESLDDLVLEETDITPAPPEPRPIRRHTMLLVEPEKKPGRPRAAAPRPAARAKAMPPAPMPEPAAQAMGGPPPAAVPKTRAGLRKAVIWSEIIGPPVALRDPTKAPGRG